MRTRTRVGTCLILFGICLLVAANRLGGQTRQPAQPPRTTVQPVPRPAQPVRDPLLTTPEGQQPTIFEALWGIIENTDEGRGIDAEQRKLLHDDLARTNQQWREMKVEMKTAIRRANGRFVRHPGAYPAAAPVAPLN